MEILFYHSAECRIIHPVSLDEIVGAYIWMNERISYRYWISSRLFSPRCLWIRVVFDSSSFLLGNLHVVLSLDLTPYQSWNVDIWILKDWFQLAPCLEVAEQKIAKCQESYPTTVQICWWNFFESKTIFRRFLVAKTCLFYFTRRIHQPRSTM